MGAFKYGLITVLTPAARHRPLIKKHARNRTAVPGLLGQDLDAGRVVPMRDGFPHFRPERIGAMDATGEMFVETQRGLDAYLQAMGVRTSRLRMTFGGFARPMPAR